MYRELILEKKNVSIVWCPTFLHSLIEQNHLKWKPTIPREQRGSILDCCQATILMTSKGFFVMSSDTVAIKCSMLNLPSCGLSDLQVRDDFTSLKRKLFPRFCCYDFHKKGLDQTGWTQWVIYTKRIIFLWHLYVFWLTDFCAALFGLCRISGSPEKFVSILNKRE